MRRLVLAACVTLTVAGVVSLQVSPAGGGGGAGCSSWSGAGFTDNSAGGSSGSSSGSGSGSSSGSGSGGSSDGGGVMGEDAAIDCAGYEAGPLQCDLSLDGVPPITFAFVDAAFSEAVPRGGSLTSGTYYEVNVDTYAGAVVSTTKKNAILYVDACNRTMSYNDNGTIRNLAGTYTVDDSGTSLSMQSDQSCCQATGNCGALDLGYTALEGAVMLFTKPSNGGNRMEMYIKQ